MSALSRKALCSKGPRNERLNGDSLSSREGNFKVLFSVLGVDLGEVEGLREEVVDEGAEGDAVGPAAREVGDRDFLETKQKFDITKNF